MLIIARIALLALLNGVVRVSALPDKSTEPEPESVEPYPESAGTGELAEPHPESAGPEETYEPNPSVGGGGKAFKDSAHFRVYGAPEGKAEPTLKMMEGAYDCYVKRLGWTSSGISFKATSNAGKKYKENIYAVPTLGTAAGQMFGDPRTGYSYVKVISSAVSDPTVTVHEYGHALTYHERSWVEQQRTGVWWEPVANWFADTYINSDLCAQSRKNFGQPTGDTRLAARAVTRIINGAHQTIVDGTPGTGTYYESWPFLTYLTNNPDRIKGLGTDYSSST